MIVATINSQDFLLDNIGDAETLLQIMQRAQPIDSTYDEQHRTYYYPDNHCDVGVNITSRELVTLEEHNRRTDARRKRQSAMDRAQEAA